MLFSNCNDGAPACTINAVTCSAVIFPAVRAAVIFATNERKSFTTGAGGTTAAFPASGNPTLGAGGTGTAALGAGGTNTGAGGTGTPPTAGGGGTGTAPPVPAVSAAALGTTVGAGGTSTAPVPGTDTGADDAPAVGVLVPGGRRRPDAAISVVTAVTSATSMPFCNLKVPSFFLPFDF
jgi:hypothetical protein